MGKSAPSPGVAGERGGPATGRPRDRPKGPGAGARPTGRSGAGTRVPCCFVALVAVIAAIEAFFLLRPLVGASPYYGPRTNTGYSYWYLVIAPFLPYAAALREHRAGRRVPLPALFAIAVVLHLALVPAPASQSQDIYQGLLYGKMALHGVNPYAVAPRSLGADPWGAWALWDDTPSVYGPIWTLLCSAAVTASGTSLTAAFLIMKTLSAAFTLLATWLLVRVRRSRASGVGESRDDGWVVLAFAYNPLVLFSSGLGAHADVVVAATLAGAILAEARERDVWTTLLLTSAGLVKAYAALALLAWLFALARRRRPMRATSHGVVALLVAAAAYAPFYEGTRTFEGLRVISRAASNSLIGTVVRIVSGHPTDAFAAGRSVWGLAGRWLAFLAIVAITVHLVRSPPVRSNPWHAAALLLTAYTALTPWYLPWHLLGLLVLAVLAPGAPTSIAALVFSGTSLVVGSGGNVPGLMFQAAVRYGPPALAAYRSRRDS